MGQGALSSKACCVNVGGRDIAIDVMRLRVDEVDEVTGALTEYAGCKSCCFHCFPNEFTTNLELPVTKTYRLQVEAYACGRPVGWTPALIRKLGPGDVTNMQVQVVSLSPPDTLDPATGGAICPRGDPAACCPAVPAPNSDAFAVGTTCPIR